MICSHNKLNLRDLENLVLPILQGSSVGASSGVVGFRPCRSQTCGVFFRTYEERFFGTFCPEEAEMAVDTPRRG